MVGADDPRRTFVHLGVGPETGTIDGIADFWATVDQCTELHTGRLETGLEIDDDRAVREMHPGGDELIAVTAGTVHVHPDDGATTGGITLTAPDFVMVPASTWHKATARGPARLPIVIWCGGGEHRPRRRCQMSSASSPSRYSATTA